jgi:type I restriction enzyme M protein
VMLRTLHVNKYARNDDWQSEDGQIKGSHDEHDNVRPEYVASITLYDEKGNLKEGLLDPDCIEARGWNLSTGQYKPFTFSTVQSDKSVADMLRELQEKEQQIIVGIDKLLAMVEGRE